MLNRKKWLMPFIFLPTVLPLAESGWSADSFDYMAFPPGFYVADYPAYYASQQVTDKNGDTLIPNMDLHSSVNVVKFAFYTGDPFWRKPLQITAVFPFGRIEMLGQHSVGVGDPTVVIGHWPIINWAKGFGTGPGCYVDIPLGKYDASKAVNIGSNYWRVRPTWVLSRFVYPYDVEAAVTYNIYFENSDTKLRNGNEIVFDSFLGRFVKPRYMAGVHFNYITGADKELNSVELPDTAVRQFQAGPSITFTPSQTCNVMFKVLVDFGSRNTTQGVLSFLRVGWKVK